MNIFCKTVYSQIFYSIEYFVIANAEEYDTFHIELQSTIFTKKLNRVPCLYWVGVPCLYIHIEYYSMSDSPIFVKVRIFLLLHVQLLSCISVHRIQPVQLFFVSQGRVSRASVCQPFYADVANGFLLLCRFFFLDRM